MVLEALVPCFLQKLKSNTVTMESASAARDEIAAIAALATSLQALLYSSEALTRSRLSPKSGFLLSTNVGNLSAIFNPNTPPQANDSSPDVPL